MHASVVTREGMCREQSHPTRTIAISRRDDDLVERQATARREADFEVMFETKPWALTLPLHPAERKSAIHLTNSFRNGSVDRKCFPNALLMLKKAPRNRGFCFNQALPMRCSRLENAH